MHDDMFKRSVYSTMGCTLEGRREREGDDERMSGQAKILC